MEEQELLQRARGGDQAAFGLLMEQYERQVYRQALGLVGHPEDAADVTQEVFLKVWRGLPAFQGVSSFSTSLDRLTGNAAIDLLPRETIIRGLALLSEEHRQVLVLRELNGASYEEIGQVLGLPPGTVKSRVARARLALAKLLKEEL